MLLTDDLRQANLAELQAAKGWQNRYKILLGWSKLISTKPQIRLPENLVQGCESPTWVQAEVNAGTCRLAIDSDSRVVKGLAVLLLLIIDDKSPAEIHSPQIEQAFTALELGKHLSPSRNNGFKGMLERVRELATTASRP